MSTTSVDPVTLAQQARTICQVAEDLRVAASAWQAKLTDPGAGLQLTTATSAVEDVREVWADDFAVYSEVLEQWCTAATAAAQGYATVDEYLARRYDIR
jgi:hypothetical protein